VIKPKSILRVAKNVIKKLLQEFKSFYFYLSMLHSASAEVFQNFLLTY